jgi:hypothetical protein
MDPTQTFLVPTHVTFQQIAGETVLLDLASGAYFSLNRVGSRIWQLVLAGASLEDICLTIGAEFDASNADVEGDARALLDSLLTQGLVEACT